MKFRSDLICNVLNNQENLVENAIRSISLDKRIMVAQGYGVTSDVPIRFLSYAIPVLRLARQLPPTTKIVFYFAKEGVMRANQIKDPAQINESLDLMQNVLKKYIKQFHPNLKQEVIVATDIVMTNEIENVIQNILPYAKEIYEKNESVRNFISKRGGLPGLKYMLEHSLYMRDPISHNGSILPELVPEMKDGFDVIIMIGGTAERIFYDFRKKLIEKSEIHNQWQAYQFFTPIGDPPTYHLQEGEPSLKLKNINEDSFADFLYRIKQIKNEFNKQKNLVRDYIILLQDIAGVEFFKIELSKVLSKSLENSDKEILERGYSNLKKWIIN